ncbi:hypothetical protein BCR44DRAFT_1446544 [Catenaria anguillulae PL171]|uniref:DUF4246 domain-containing protein n=1 Tax=Catenaria anguillulae PL171 TaxID=765915 RepID=A0A1Y2H651_9FUNG|nr:hypothetical protein BCR44DRAFT_1446544 [Catenaria anguillulae PL171]
MMALYTLPFFNREDDYMNEEAPYLPMTLVELDTHAVLNAVRDKFNWAAKFNDPAIRAKWQAEIAALSRVNRRMLRYVMAELEWTAQHEPTAGGPDNVFVSDTAVNETTRERLIQLISKLEDVPDNKKDWHPRSDNQVLDLVHPSLFPLVYGRTHVRDRAVDGNEAQSVAESFASIGSGKGAVAVAPSKQSEFSSIKFQWLPSDAMVNAETKQVKLLSYINNLHPVHHAELYEVIEEVLAAMVPLWQSTLARIHRPQELRIHTDSQRWYRQGGYVDPDDVTSDDDEYATTTVSGAEPESKTAGNPVGPKLMDLDLPDNSDDDDADFDPDAPAKATQADTDGDAMDVDGDASGSEDEEDDDDEEDEDEDDDWWELQPRVTPTSFVPEPAQLAGKRIQVIIKLANIHLTPEKPMYKGGSWHVEGMLNESIIATGLYYYAMDNITESRLEFRTAVQGPEYEQSDYRGMRTIYGLDNEDELNQPRGYITAHQGRIVTFPNLYQHQVQPFKLADPTRPGYRKILAVFLVDPSKTVPSTAVVAPQQAEWMMEQLHAQDNRINDVFPVEIVEGIVNKVGGPLMSLAEAKELRLELMDERTALVSHNDKATFSARFNLCEH